MRDWKAVNRKYITEGELYLSFDFLESWKREVAALNEHKEGARFRYPTSLIQFCSVLQAVFHLRFRQQQGFLNSLQKWIPIPAVPSYTQIDRRINDLGIDIVDSLVDPKDGQVIAIDSSGIKLYNSGEWIREKHKKRKPFLKLHIAVNIKTKQAVALEVTEDSVVDQYRALPLVRAAQKIEPVTEVLLDGAYDVHNIWRKLKERNIKPIIRLRENASPSGLGFRAQMVRERDRIGQEQWARKHGYGQRWQSESWFSSFKRRFGEYCCARSPKNVIKEIVRKAALCNQLIC
jgi:hypothetical protein